MRYSAQRSKLSDDQLDECARRYRKEDATLMELAALFGVSTSTIQNGLRMRGVAMRPKGKRRKVAT